MRADHDLAFLLQYENIAWYEQGAVRILDRRIYPAEIKYVTCTRHEEVADAIRNMVTQSGGPYMAAAMGMVLAAYEGRSLSVFTYKAHLKKAAYTLSHARPTTVSAMEEITKSCLLAGIAAIEAGNDPVDALFQHAVSLQESKYQRIGLSAAYLVEKFPQKGAVMTQCFAETIVGLMLREAKEKGKEIKLYCPETRPYFQGSRLTASVAYDQGFDVTVITDNMPGYVMVKKGIDLFTSAADVITMDGHVVNKVGTFQIALAADYFHIPYYVSGIPSLKHPTIDSVEIEERDGFLVTEAMGVKTAKEGVKGYYPAFDITPPNLVTGVVTDKGIFAPTALASVFS